MLDLGMHLLEFVGEVDHCIKEEYYHCLSRLFKRDEF